MLLWHRQVPFCYSIMFKKFLSLPNHRIRECVKGKGINRGVGYGLELPAEYIFHRNEKANRWAKGISDGVNGNVRVKGESEGAGFYKFFRNNFEAQGTTELNISWPSNFVKKHFMAQPINFSFLFKDCLC